jgi:threonine/homoserine/homoserine lactone efflux protein
MTGLLAFAGISALVIVMPGQDTALTIRNTLVGGRGSGAATAAGVAAGLAIWTVAASAGLGALLAASEPAFLALRVAGGAYLVWLGAHAMWTAWRGRSAGLGLEGPAPRGRSRRSAARQGVLSNLGNPKIVVFFTSLLPQFASSFAGLLALGLTFCAMTLAWLTLYALVVERAGGFLRRRRVQQAMEAITGTVLVAVGLRLATERP